MHVSEAHGAVVQPASEPRISGARAPGPASRSPGGFRHELLPYSGAQEFLDGTLPLIERALDEDEPVLVAVARVRTDLLRDALGERAARVGFCDMQQLGRNPARIIPAWQRFVDRHAPLGKPLLGIGEPVWPGRDAAALNECERHESLLNFAFAQGAAWRLLCPYDLDGLGASAIDAARQSHPYVAQAAAGNANSRYREASWPRRAFGGALPEPAGPVREMAFSRQQLPAARHLVGGLAGRAGLPRERVEQLVLAVSELATNSVLYGGGTGRLRVWLEGRTLLCDVRDSGRIELPLAGRIEPRPDQLASRGLWLANQVCDLVQIRSDESGTIARLHMDLQPLG
jgi:anti-sigma regulatory factor (Ser/Thr protein kinase)